MGRIIKARNLVEVKKKDSLSDKQTKVQWHLINDFMPIIQEVARLMTVAKTSSTHYEGEWKEESIQHELDCFDRHMYEARYGEYKDPQFGMPANIHALCRLMMYIYKIERD